MSATAGDGTAREAILARLRHAYARDDQGQAEAEAKVAARLGDPDPNLVPARGRLDPEARVTLFTEMAQAVMADVRRLPSMAEAAAAVAAYLRQHNLPQRVTVAPDPRLDRAGWEGQPLLRARRGAADPADLVGVTIAEAGAAETGTLLLASSADRPQLLAFLPETSIVVVPAGRIGAGYEDAWELVRAMPGGPPRAVNLITGPSRTADIAGKLELGAHGPRRLLVLIVDDLGAAAA